MININNKKLLIILSVTAIIIGIFLRFYIYNKTILGNPPRLDEQYQFYQTKKHIKEKRLPIEGAFLNTPETYDSEEDSRVPGGYFYLTYMIKYLIGGQTYEGARLVNLITSILISIIFFVWLYKRFSLTTFTIILMLMSVNVYFLRAGNDIYNPHNPFILSFIFLPVLYEYLYNEKKFIYAVLLFPILALSAQCHFSNFFSIIPSLIVFLIIRWKKDTKKNIIPLSIGVFISFLTYLPYLIYQFKNNFESLSKILGRKSELAHYVIQPPQIYSIFLFTTNESGGKYTNGIKDIINAYFGSNPLYAFTFIFYILSLLFALTALIYTYKHFFTKKMVTDNDKKTNALKDLLFFYIVYIISTIVFYMVGGIAGGGRPHYFYSSFTLGFVPIIYFIENINYIKSKYINYICLYALLNMIAIFIYRI
ncbi:hypothetical protein Bint_1972 [Brachyspira intermedia PWS/A]|uniref:Glycosyltransferase RgtA/B/C/D-like domain-containing protein n=1 Tax=Brachyspira intermedia (strain ATCC 51140 / PWS/A) TaxID=1045858 RepID=G0EKK2_BRAIP|nr:hypothetical protein [Brachyspira intermedia]AEM22588.1 hypothetical protein Bint_1972 [Brachyspira intermedia PWS/A]